MVESTSTLRRQIGQPWIQCLLHFNFDLEKGAILDLQYPEHILSAQEEKDIRNLAFPEVCQPTNEN